MPGNPGKGSPMDDTRFMRMALALAEEGRGFTSPNPMVGAVVVKDGEVVGRGFHRACGTPHAEVNAIDDAGDKARGADIYVTLEPCNHTGKTPPCTRKILSAGIRRVVTAVSDPNPKAAGGNQFLREKGLTVVEGVCEEEGRVLVEDFLKFVKTGRPFVIVKCAATLDGRIATRTGDSKWVTGPDAREYVHLVRHAVDGIMVGVDTVKADNPSLTTRIEGGVRGKAARDPRRIVLDTRLSISPSAKLLSVESETGAIVVCGPDPDGEKRAAVEATGALVLETPLKEGRIDLDPLMDSLGSLGITSLLIEGGACVIASALSARIVDKVQFFYAPKILGGDDGIPVTRGAGPELMRDALDVSDMTVRTFGKDIMVEGYLR